MLIGIRASLAWRKRPQPCCLVKRRSKTSKAARLKGSDSYPIFLIFLLGIFRDLNIEAGSIKRIHQFALDVEVSYCWNTMDSSDSRNHHGRRHSSHRHDHQRQRDARSRSPNEPSTHSRTQGHAAMDRSHRERSPHTHHRKRKHSSHTKPEGEEIVLPDNARKLVKSDLASFRPLLGLYLDIQKGKDIEDMEEDEVKGRWKSFLGKW